MIICDVTVLIWCEFNYVIFIEKVLDVRSSNIYLVKSIINNYILLEKSSSKMQYITPQMIQEVHNKKEMFLTRF